jgi:hypothetical protein
VPGLEVDSFVHEVRTFDRHVPACGKVDQFPGQLLRLRLPSPISRLDLDRQRMAVYIFETGVSKHVVAKDFYFLISIEEVWVEKSHFFDRVDVFYTIHFFSRPIQKSYKIFVVIHIIVFMLPSNKSLSC